MDLDASLRIAATMVAALGSAACAEAYLPRPSPRVATVVEAGGAIKIAKNGRLEDAGAFCGGLEALVRGNPRAEEEAASCSSSRVGGFAMGMVGAAGAGAGAGLMLSDAGHHQGHLDTPGYVGIGIALAGLGLAIAGGVLTANSQTHYFNAINLYNDDLPPAFAPPMYGVPGAVPAPGYSPLPGYSGPQWAPAPSAPPAAAPPAPSAPPTSPGALPPPAPLPPGALPPAGTAPVPLQR